MQNLSDQLRMNKSRVTRTTPNQLIQHPLPLNIHVSLHLAGLPHQPIQRVQWLQLLLLPALLVIIYC